MPRSTFHGKQATRKLGYATLSAAKPLTSEDDNDSSREKFDTNTIQDDTGVETSDFAPAELDRGTTQRQNKIQKLQEKDYLLLGKDTWSANSSHGLTYAGLFLFTFTLYFRPYELIPAFSGFSSIAFIIAITTLIIYLPTQISAEGTVTTLPVEVKCILFLTFWAVITIPIAKDPALAWDKFNEHFSKVAIIFVVMVNTLRTPARIKGLMWLGIAVGVMLSYQAVGLYRAGVFKVEGYRVAVDFGGMFGNPNDMATHLVMFAPISIALGFAAKGWLPKLVYFASPAIMAGGVIVAQSRSGLLGLMTAALVLGWKVRKGNGLKVISGAFLIVVAVLILAPGNLTTRIQSIVIPSLDPVGSADERRKILIASIWITLRNPIGIGIGNFPVVGPRNLETHNAYTQISSELGWLAFSAYMIFLVSPLRKLSALQRQTRENAEYGWIYHVSIGVYASIAGYMVSSFFGSVAYIWYAYYGVAYAISLRRIYQLQAENEVSTLDGRDSFT